MQTSWPSYGSMNVESACITHTLPNIPYIHVSQDLCIAVSSSWSCIEPHLSSWDKSQPWPTCGKSYPRRSKMDQGTMALPMSGTTWPATTRGKMAWPVVSELLTALSFTEACKRALSIKCVTTSVHTVSPTNGRQVCVQH